MAKVKTQATLPELDDTGQDALETSISLEIDIEEYLVRNLAHLESGLRLYQVESVNPRQFDRKTVGIIEILATDTKANVVLIQPKAGEADDRVRRQLQRYMGEK